MAEFPALNAAEKQCLKDFLSVAVNHNRSFLTDYGISQFGNEFKISPIFLKKFFNQLTQKGVLYRIIENDNQAEYHIADEYIDEIYKFSEQEGIIKPETQNPESDEELEFSPIPASDRFVSRSDNEDAAQSAIQALSELSKRIIISNELTASSEERVALSKEIDGLKEVVSQSKVRVATIWNAITGSGVLRWLAERAADAAVNAIAFDAITHLSKLCGFG
ncbi:MAG: hypothetical protein ACYCZB_08045 [Acidiphilium sp.]